MFEKNGGIVKQESIADKFLEKAYKNEKNEFNSLNLIFYILQVKKLRKPKSLKRVGFWLLLTKKNCFHC